MKLEQNKIYWFFYKEPIRVKVLTMSSHGVKIQLLDIKHTVTVYSNELFLTSQECIVYNFNKKHNYLLNTLNEYKLKIKETKEEIKKLKETFKIDKIKKKYPELFI